MSGIGRRIKKIRTELNMTQEEFGALFGIKRSGISKYEYDECFPTREMVIVLVDKYNISMDWLLCNRGTMYYEKYDTPLAHSGFDVDTETRDMLVLLTRSAMVRYAVMGFFQRFRLENLELLQKELKASITKEKNNRKKK